MYITAVILSILYYLYFIFYFILWHYIHSVSKETNNEFIGLPCDPGSRSGDPGRVVIYHKNFKQVAKNASENVKRFSRYLGKSKGMSSFEIHPAPKESIHFVSQ